MAGKGLARMLAQLYANTNTVGAGASNGNANPEINTPDLTRVKNTNNDHPQPQCRLDTYFAGGLCDVNPDIDVSSDKSDVGVCLFDRIGGRPACWYAEASTLK